MRRLREVEAAVGPMAARAAQAEADCGQEARLRIAAARMALQAHRGLHAAAAAAAELRLYLPPPEAGAAAALTNSAEHVGGLLASTIDAMGTHAPFSTGAGRRRPTEHGAGGDWHAPPTLSLLEQVC